MTGNFFLSHKEEGLFYVAMDGGGHMGSQLLPSGHIASPSLKRCGE